MLRLIFILAVVFFSLPPSKAKDLVAINKIMKKEDVLSFEQKKQLVSNPLTSLESPFSQNQPHQAIQSEYDFYQYTVSVSPVEGSISAISKKGNEITVTVPVGLVFISKVDHSVQHWLANGTYKFYSFNGKKITKSFDVSYHTNDQKEVKLVLVGEKESI